MDLDKTDRKILASLDRNCRRPIKHIASEVKLGEDAVHYRINKHEKSGLISSYIPIIDYTKLNHQIIRLYLQLQNVTPQQTQELLQFLSDKEEITIIYQIDGRYDIALGILSPNVRQYDSVYKRILRKYRSQITETEFSVFKDYIQYHRNYLIEETDPAAIHTGSFEQYDYDEIDLQILESLTEDATKSLLTIGKELDIAATTVKYRLNKLEEHKVIKAYRAQINYRAFGYGYYKVDLYLEDLSAQKQLNEYVKNHPNIIFQDVVVGGSNFEFDCELPSHDAFYEMIEDIQSKFPVREYKYYRTRNIIKEEYFPKILVD